MKESVLDVLMYLFESFVDSEDDPEPNRHELREDLEEAGFREREIDRALDWLDGLHAADTETHRLPHSATIRIYSGYEQERLDANARGYMLQLEQLGILSPPQRELVIDRLLALDTDEVDVGKLSRLGGVCSETQATALHVLKQQFREPWLIERDFTPLQLFDLCRVDVDTDDLVAKFRHSGCVGGTEVTGAKD